MLAYNINAFLFFLNFWIVLINLKPLLSRFMWGIGTLFFLTLQVNAKRNKAHKYLVLKKWLRRAKTFESLDIICKLHIPFSFLCLLIRYTDVIIFSPHFSFLSDIKLGLENDTIFPIVFRISGPFILIRTGKLELIKHL